MIIIKAQQFRTQEKNRQAALERLQELIKLVSGGAEGKKTDQADQKLAKKAYG